MYSLAIEQNVQDVIGMTIQQCNKYIGDNKLIGLFVQENGKRLPRPMNSRPDRILLTVDNGMVTGAKIG